MQRMDVRGDNTFKANIGKLNKSKNTGNNNNKNHSNTNTTCRGQEWVGSFMKALCLHWFGRCPLAVGVDPCISVQNMKMNCNYQINLQFELIYYMCFMIPINFKYSSLRL